MTAIDEYSRNRCVELREQIRETELQIALLGIERDCVARKIEYYVSCLPREAIPEPTSCPASAIPSELVLPQEEAIEFILRTRPDTEWSLREVTDEYAKLVESGKTRCQAKNFRIAVCCALRLLRRKGAIESLGNHRNRRFKTKSAAILESVSEL